MRLRLLRRDMQTAATEDVRPARALHNTQATVAAVYLSRRSEAKEDDRRIFGASGQFVRLRAM
jgi:hypothetical protein